MKKRKMVFFSKEELDLLEFSESKGNFSDYVKELIRIDRDNPKISFRKKSIYEVYNRKRLN